MELPFLMEELSRPAAFPLPVDRVEVRQTHISVVFLAGDVVYKIKKPVRLPFLDFSTLEKRFFYCQEETRLNRRLASDVYQGVVPITWEGKSLRFEGQGEPVEWAVKMKRLPEEAHLQYLVEQGRVVPQDLVTLGQRLVAFHAYAEAAPAQFGSFDMVAGNARDNFVQAAQQVGQTLSSDVLLRLRQLTEEHLKRLQPLIESRAQQGRTRDTHGDLRLDHVYHFPGQAPPGDWVIIDCIEFNDRFRFADPIADLAFLVMDFKCAAARGLAAALADAYFQATGQDKSQAFLPFYTAYRAAVRGKVEGLQLGEKEIPEKQRAKALASARAHWLLALGELETPEFRPCLALVGGLPGTGKSTVARLLGEKHHFQVLRSDVVRKELAGVDSGEKPAEDIYTAAWSDQTYAELLTRAEALLFQGQRVLIDANFPQETWRQTFLRAARTWGVQGLFLNCQASQETVYRRLVQRRGDASDADESVYQTQRARWEEFSAATTKQVHDVSLEGTPAEGLAAAWCILQGAGLAEGS